MAIYASKEARLKDEQRKLTERTRIERSGDGKLTRKTSSWDNYLYRKALDRVPELRSTVKNGLERADKFGLFTKELKSRLMSGTSNDIEKLEEVHASDEWANKFHDELVSLPEWEQLKSVSSGNDEWSSIGATALAEGFMGQMPKKEEPLQDVESKQRQLEQLQKLFNETGDPEAKELLDELDQEIQDDLKLASQFNESVDGYKVRQAARKACLNAQETIKDVEKAMTALGCGKGAGSGGPGSGADDKMKLAKELQRNKKLKRVMEMAGRQLSICAEKRATMSELARNELYGVNKGDDVDWMLDEEAALLMTPELRHEFVERFAEKRLLQYELKGNEKQSKGPVVLCVDNSGSMAGQPEELSKAVALALMEQCRKDKRAFALLHFDDGVGFRLRHTEKNPASLNQILEAISFFSCGGTDFYPVLKEACQVVADESANVDMKKADIVLLTDGVAPFGKDLEQKIMASAKKYGTQLITILIGYHLDNSFLAVHKDKEGFYGATQRLGTLTSVEDITKPDNMLEAIYRGI